MILEFGVFYLVFWWVVTVLCTNNKASKFLEEKGNKLKKGTILNKWFLGVSRCQFCFENYVAALCVLGYHAYTGEYYFWYWGVLYTSINSWLRTFFK